MCKEENVTQFREKVNSKTEAQITQMLKIIRQKYLNKDDKNVQDSNGKHVWTNDMYVLAEEKVI